MCWLLNRLSVQIKANLYENAVFLLFLHVDIGLESGACPPVPPAVAAVWAQHAHCCWPPRPTWRGGRPPSSRGCAFSAELCKVQPRPRPCRKRACQLLFSMLISPGEKIPFRLFLGVVHICSCLRVVPSATVTWCSEHLTSRSSWNGQTRTCNLGPCLFATSAMVGALSAAVVALLSVCPGAWCLTWEAVKHGTGTPQTPDQGSHGPERFWDWRLSCHLQGPGSS